MTITEYLTADHERLDKLLARVVEQESLQAGASITSPNYNAFKNGMLLHIRIEETLLLPAAKQANNGEPLAIAAKLRLDHGAIAALVVPPPNLKLLQALQTVLKSHNPLEDGPLGAYAVCDTLLDNAEVARIIQTIGAMSPVPFSKTINPVLAMESAGRALERAGFSRSLVS